ncbi:FAD-binding oxidoreductase [Aetokthonos hydrillicola Thurmond2011]|uniref:FAD-binding oxidoreductase n=1 Tax=Aetokthonos hydrillicola Thurmond2011 TaxID=2712845 RepID=A0AAP5MAB0_9CYAN|nr:FAD-binding oxidoreductase [Aetokthonos hydrillicola]MBO3460588.1 FAD-binding oxidoreductase [Aetokthonos hydrillicola CCALA 1050]MBW4585284.1 FAD-binding oxidoreductase [Aetokthonos hydrillicola CCALA 1050]MDR9896582.1 FAD-binding oxidoreductase [Aetokthonos hydrillicola Thurmond2011]
MNKKSRVKIKNQKKMDHTKQAIQAWKDKIGTNKVEDSKQETEKYTQNITEYKSELPIAVLKPESKSDVEAIIAIANKFEVPIYVVSTGKNWGIGSKIPVQNGSALLILSEMKKIIEVNEKLRYAIIEPGVTQKQLSDYLLRNTNLMLPVTGSAENTSVVGNVLDRGSVFFNHRYDLLTGLEVFLGNGKVLKTGFWHYFDSNKTKKPIFFHPPGVGPDLNGIFTQSNLGIVTAMVIRLEPRIPSTIVYAEFKEDNFVAFIDTFIKLKENKLIHNWLMITNKNDPRTTVDNKFNYTGDWSAIFNFFGTEEIRILCKKEVEKQIYKLCYHLLFLNSLIEDNSSHRYYQVLQMLYNGIPSNYSIKTMGEMNNFNLKSSDYEIDFCKKIYGFIAVVPAIPFEAMVIKEVIDLVNKVSQEFQVTPFHNFVSIGEMAIEGLFRVYFDREKEEEITKAHQWAEQLSKELEEIGIYPYRMSIKEMNHFSNRQEDPYWETIAAIKKQVDPNNIISPGKYCLENI